MSNEELVKLVQEGQDPDGCYIMQLWRQNHGLIWQSVKIYTKFDNEEDLMQEAFIGLRKAVDFYDPNMNIICIHPGWIRTNPGNHEAPLDPYEHAETLRCLFETKRHDKDGPVFVTYTGEAYPW